MIRNGGQKAKSNSASPKQIFSPAKVSITSPTSSHPKHRPQTFQSPYSAAFAYRVSQIKQRVLVNLYGHTGTDRVSLFSSEKRETITIPKVRPDADSRERVKSPLTASDAPSVRPVLAVASPCTPKSEMKSPPSVNYINFSDHLRTCESSHPSRRFFAPKKILVQGSKSHINRAEKRQQVDWLVAGRSAFGGTENNEETQDRLNRTMPNIRFSEDDAGKQPNTQKKDSTRRGTSLLQASVTDDVAFKLIKEQEKRLLCPTRSRANSSRQKPTAATEEEESKLNPPQIVVEKSRCSTAEHTHDRTTSMSFDFNENWKVSRVLPLNKVDIGKVWAVPSSKNRTRPASAKYSARKTFF